MAFADNAMEREKVAKVIRDMLESSFYLEMKLAERLKLVKMLVESYT